MSFDEVMVVNGGVTGHPVIDPLLAIGGGIVAVTTATTTFALWVGIAAICAGVYAISQGDWSDPGIVQIGYEPGTTHP